MFSEKAVQPSAASLGSVSWWVHRTRLARAGEERRERLSWPRETKPRKISSVTGEYESTSRARCAEQQTTQQQHRARRLTSSSASPRLITNQTSTGSSEAPPMDEQAGNTRMGQFVVRFYLRWDDINFEKRCWPKSAHDAGKWDLENARYSVGCDLEFWRLIRFKSLWWFLQREELCHHSFVVHS